METNVPPKIRTFLAVQTASEIAGFSVRHFERILKEDGVRILWIGRKRYILGKDFERWQSTKKVGHN